MPLEREKLHVDDPLLGAVVGVLVSAAALVVTILAAALLLYVVAA
jgi:hypothetical protein